MIYREGQWEVVLAVTVHHGQPCTVNRGHGWACWRAPGWPCSWPCTVGRPVWPADRVPGRARLTLHGWPSRLAGWPCSWPCTVGRWPASKDVEAAGPRSAFGVLPGPQALLLYSSMFLTCLPSSLLYYFHIPISSSFFTPLYAAHLWSFPLILDPAPLILNTGVSF